MRNLKKFLALVLAMMMAMSLMITANAANEADNATKVYPDGDSVTEAFVEAVDVLSGMKVFKGRDTGNFDAGATITRAETAAIIYRLMTADVEDVQADLFRNVTHPFTDVKPTDWYAGYIGFLWNAGIIKGQTATTFNPYGQVTGYEALAMILRAVGYDQNHEFEGSNWVVNVASIAQRKGILKDVESANYGGPYLYSAARRDVVASLLFRTAAFVPQVIYTSAFQYTESGMGTGPIANTTVNQSLGEQNFGLRYAHGVVVGNQATGETSTKISFASAPTAIAGVNGTDTAMTTVNAASYIYDTVRYQGAYGTVQSASMSFNWTTDLRMFNHAVRVWYDCRDGANKDTYALYDRVVKTAVVHATDADLTAETGDLYSEATNGGSNTVDNNWKAPGFSISNTLMYVYLDKNDQPADPANPANDDKGWTPVNSQGAAFFNWGFTRMDFGNQAIDGSITGTKFGKSPVLKNDEANEWGLYLLISNSTDNNLDVVIPLDLTFTRISQRNTTTGKQSVGVITQNGAGTEYFDTFDQVDPAVGDDYSSIAVANLKNSPKTDLGTKVAAITITGTNGSRNNNLDRVAANTNTVDFGFATKGAGLKTATNTVAGTNTTTDSTYYYQLTENTIKKTATVWKVDTSNQDVYLSDGSVLHQSVFAEATDGSFINGAANLNGMEGYDAANNNFRLKNGTDAYTFTLDEQGNYIYWETAAATASFVYGTYIDWTSVVASSQFDYPMVYVNAAGEGDQKVNVTSVNGNAMDIVQYNGIKLPKRDSSGANGGNNSGFVKGRYIGYALGSDGSLNAVTDTDSKDTGFLQGTAADFGSGQITIDSDSVNVGAEPVVGMADMFLTNNTRFVIVDGAGTDNQSVKVYDGIAKLMEGMDSVEIDGQTDIPAADAKYLSDKTQVNPVYQDVDDPYLMFYYLAGRFDYDQNYDASADEIKTLFLPAPCVKFNASSTSSMVFVGQSDAKIINSNNGKWATLFTVYQNGEGKDVWIAGHYTTAGTDSKTIVDNGDNVFYNLVETGDKASDGNVIYKLAAVSGDAKILGQYWDGTSVQNKGNFDTAGDEQHGIANATPLLYMATTFNQQAGYINTAATGPETLFNVGTAGIKNLNTANYPGIQDNNLTTLNGASSLTSNIGVPVSCILSADRVVSFIYVNAD